MTTIEERALLRYAATPASSAPTKRKAAVAQRIPALSGAGHIIRRPRLTRLLEGAESRLLLLVAPAGFGKTTLAREWVAARGRTGVWFRATPTCTDPAALALELAHVLEPFRTGVTRRVSDHLKVIESPDIDVLGELLVEPDSNWTNGAWFVVDDYHLVMASPEAERLLERVSRSAERVLITARERPKWVDARLLLYGDAFELGQSVLAMTHEEAEAVLAIADRKPAGLVALANGWPAVIGLAALLPEEITPTVDVPGELHEYLAQELYNSLDIGTRRALVLLSLPDTIDLDLVFRVEPNAGTLLAEAETRGFLASSDDSELESHPLVRSFLRSKFAEEAAAIDEPVSRLLDCLFERHQWDDAFTVIEQTQRRGEIARLIGDAAAELLNAGRIGLPQNRSRPHVARRSIGIAPLTLTFAQGTLRICRRSRTWHSVTFSTRSRAITRPRRVAARYGANSSALHSSALQRSTPRERDWKNSTTLLRPTSFAYNRRA